MMKRFIFALMTLMAFSRPAAGQSVFISVPLDQAGGKALDSYAEGSPWASVPAGDQTYGGVPFKLTTKLQLHGNQDAKDKRYYHARVIGLPVHHRLTRLHFLHGANISEKNSRPIASVRVNYAGGSNYTFFITYGIHVRNWWKDEGGKDTVTDPGSSVVWTGRSDDSDKDGKSHRLYKSAFDLPAGMPLVESLDLFSLFSASSEVIVAITGESSATATTSPPPSADDSKYRESVTVKVANHKGNPILGAHARGWATEARGTNLNTTTSTRLGRMDDLSAEIGTVVVDFPAGARSLNLTAQAAKCVPQDINLVRGTNGQFQGDASVRLAPGVEIGGVVRDPDGQPLAKARVEVHRTWPSTVWYKFDDILTDAQGRWRTDQAPESVRDLRFTVTHANFHRSEFEMYGDKGEDGLTRASLLGSQAEFQMGRKLNVAGTVRDTAGRLLTNIYVSLVRTHLNGSSSSGARTDRRGVFRFTDVDHVPSHLVVQDTTYAPLNYAPLVLPVDPTQDTAPVRLVLSAGIPLRGQFVERVSTNSPETRPIPGLTLSITAGDGGLIRWSGKTDTNGSFEWPHAPDGPLRLLAWGTGRNQRAFIARAGPGVVQLDFSPVSSWQGIARDEENQEAIPEFTVMPGYRNGDGRWGWLDHLKAQGRAGEFTYTDQGQWGFLKIEAPGYEPRAFPMPERGRTNTNHFTLRRGTVVKGVVKLPDGSPADGAQVLLLGDGRLMLPLAFGLGTLTSQDRAPNGRSFSATADREGRFELPSHFLQNVLVVHPAGYAEITLSNLAARAEVQLEPYGTVEGVLLEGPSPVAGGVVQLSGDHPNYGLPYDTNFIARTDDQGRFRFTHVPPGLRWLARRVETAPRHVAISHNTPVEVAPGVVTQAQVGGTGRTVVAKVNVPAGVTVDWSRSDMKIFSTPRTRRFRTAEQQAAWQATLEARTDVTASYAVLASADGRLRAVDVPPGRHRLQLYLRAPSGSANTSGAMLQYVSRELEVDGPSEGRSDEAVDLGPLEWSARR